MTIQHPKNMCAISVKLHTHICMYTFKCIVPIIEKHAHNIYIYVCVCNCVSSLKNKSLSYPNMFTVSVPGCHSTTKLLHDKWPLLLLLPCLLFIAGSVPQGLLRPAVMLCQEYQERAVYALGVDNDDDKISYHFPYDLVVLPSLHYPLVN